MEKDNQVETIIGFSHRYLTEAQNFFGHYKEQTLMVCETDNPKEIYSQLKAKKNRVCRFCRKDANHVTFRKDAHILSSLLGNRYFISDFECDSCNELFSRYETDLSHYLGATTSLSMIPNRKNKIPNFNGKDLSANNHDFHGHNTIKIDPKNPKDSFKLNEATGERTITFIKQPYIPINVYKAMAKMAVCLMNDKEVKQYFTLLKFLLTNEFDNVFPSLPMHVYTIPASRTYLTGFLFRKLPEKTNVLSHTFILNFDHFVFQIYLPFNINDREENYHLYQMPPIFDLSGDPKWYHTGEWIEELSSTEKRVDDKQTLRLQPQSNEFENRVGIDQEGYEVESTYDPNNIASIIITKDNFSIPIKKREP